MQSSDMKSEPGFDLESGTGCIGQICCWGDKMTLQNCSKVEFPVIFLSVNCTCIWSSDAKGKKCTRQDNWTSHDAHFGLDHCWKGRTQEDNQLKTC